MVRYTLKQLYYFCAVADHGGIAQAARALNLSQPAIAQALNKLEEQYDLVLFLRQHSRGVELTAQGRQLYTQAQHLLTEAEEQETAMQLIAAGKTTSIRLGCFHTLAPFYMIPLLRHYQAHHQNTAIQAEEMLQDRLVQKLLNNELDLAITYDMSLPHTNLVKHQIAALRPHVLLSKQHPLAKHKTIVAKQLVGQAMVVFEGAGSRDYYQNLMAKLELAPNIALVSQSMETVRSAVGNQLGFAFTVMQPKSETSYDGSELVSIPLADECPNLAIILLCTEAFSDLPVIKEILTQIRQ